MNSAEVLTDNHYLAVCEKSDLIENSGICALVAGQQVALFYLPDEQPQLYAVANWDPIGKANVLSRGIIGDINGRLVVASPLYKQHFDLVTGECLEDESHRIATWDIGFSGSQVVIKVSE